MTRNNGKPVNSGQLLAHADNWENHLEHNDDDDDDVIKKGERRKAEPQTSNSSKPKPSVRDKGGSRPENSHEKRERRLREKREREAIETELRERERDFERKRHGSIARYRPRKPPAGYKDPHDVCRQPVPVKVKEEKKRQMKALMNCIAFSPADPTPARMHERGRSVPRKEEMDNSLSSDTTSDMTDVTPRSSSSGCSSMSKHSVSPEQDSGVQQERTAAIIKRSRSEGRGPRRSEDKKHEPDYNGNIQTTEAELEMEEMRYLQEAFEDFDLDEETSDFATSIISGLSAERRAKCGRKNMTFTNEQLREIERVNLILLKKIMAQKKPRSTGPPPPSQHRKTSSAVNRARTEKNIDKENMVLLRKLQNVKSTTTSMARKPQTPTVC